MIRWYNTLISVVLALAIGFGACLVFIPREIVVEPVMHMHFSPTLQVGPESFWEPSEPAPTSPRLPHMEKTAEFKDEARAPRNLAEWWAAFWARWVLR